MNQVWSSLKQSKPTSPDEFMATLFFIVPSLTLDFVIQLRRTQKTKQTARDICDFIWTCLQPDSEKWQTQIDQLWPAIFLIMEEQRMEDMFECLPV